MPDAPHEDVFDYPMSDAFISDTRPRPYGTRFRSRCHPRRPSLQYINALSDPDFGSYVRRGCALPSESPDLEAELAQVRAELQVLHAELQALRRAIARTVPSSSGMQGGLNVPPRS